MFLLFSSSSRSSSSLLMKEVDGMEEDWSLEDLRKEEGKEEPKLK
jgi:hypothetical protein